mgnify:CR=1|jgi:hypothetical protein
MNVGARKLESHLIGRPGATINTGYIPVIGG